MENYNYQDIGASIALTEAETGFTDVLLKSEISAKFIQAQQAKIEKYEKALKDILVHNQQPEKGWNLPHMTLIRISKTTE